MLPAIERAIVDPAKVRDYLLSSVHPVGRFKSVVFCSLGYRTEAWDVLRDDLLAHARDGDAVPGQASEYGQKYEVSGTLRGPNGRQARITAVWLLPEDNDAPRFITAFPG